MQNQHAVRRSQHLVRLDRQGGRQRHYIPKRPFSRLNGRQLEAARNATAFLRSRGFVRMRILGQGIFDSFVPGTAVPEDDEPPGQTEQAGRKYKERGAGRE